jgi:hypothetical protein
MKTCSKCNKEKSFTEFHFSKSKKDGYSSYCKKCSCEAANKYNKKNINLVIDRAKEKRDQIKLIVNNIKNKYGCYFCSEKDACCLDFHHPNDNKKDNISYLTMAKNIDKLFEEINKCIVICSNCHRKFHAGKLSIMDSKLCNENKLDFFEERNGRYYKK